MEEGSSIVAISSLGSQRVLENYVLDRHVEGGARVGRALPRRRARAARIRVNAVSGGVVDTGALDRFPNKERCSARSSARRPAGSSSRRTSRLPSRSSARPTPRWSAGRRSSSTAASRSRRDGADRPRTSRAFDDAHRARTSAVELPPIVQRTLGDLTGKRVLHLHCGTGEATRGARRARRRGDRHRRTSGALDDGTRAVAEDPLDRRDPQSLPRQLRRGRFDLVYSPRGRARPARRPRRLGDGHRRRAADARRAPRLRRPPRRATASTRLCAGSTTTSATRPAASGSGGSARS